jgi:hypothetical protein
VLKEVYTVSYNSLSALIEALIDVEQSDLQHIAEMQHDTVLLHCSLTQHGLELHELLLYFLKVVLLCDEAEVI